MDITTIFKLNKFNITAEDIVRSYFHCESIQIHKNVIVTPVWSESLFDGYVEKIITVTENILYEIEYKEKKLSFIKSGIGAPQTGDIILALSCTPCQNVLFIGSVGGLISNLKIGDLVIPTKSISGDGFSHYLGGMDLSAESFLSETLPDYNLNAKVEEIFLQISWIENPKLHKGVVFSTDSVIAQFQYIEKLVNKYNCIGIEMETAAVFRAANVVGIKASALLQLSDVIPIKKSLFSGRTSEDKNRRQAIRKNVLIKCVLEALCF